MLAIDVRNKAVQADFTSHLIHTLQTECNALAQPLHKESIVFSNKLYCPTLVIASLGSVAIASQVRATTDSEVQCGDLKSPMTSSVRRPRTSSGNPRRLQKAQSNFDRHPPDGFSSKSRDRSQTRTTYRRTPSRLRIIRRPDKRSPKTQPQLLYFNPSEVDWSTFHRETPPGVLRPEELTAPISGDSKVLYYKAMDTADALRQQLRLSEAWLVLPPYSTRGLASLLKSCTRLYALKDLTASVISSVTEWNALLLEAKQGKLKLRELLHQGSKILDLLQQWRTAGMPFKQFIYDGEDVEAHVHHIHTRLTRTNA